MDESDPDLVLFGELGCNNCIQMKNQLGKTWFMNNDGNTRLQTEIQNIKRYGKDKKFDCIIGLSGGVDSTYLALKCHDWGLRPLVIHVDAGWNSEIAVKNIQSILEYTGWPLETFVVNWPAMRDLQVAFLKSGISNQDAPQDHAFFSALYQTAKRLNIKVILSGGNMATEGILPIKWQNSAMDIKLIKDVATKNGKFIPDSYPRSSFLDLYFLNPFIHAIRPVRLLNFLSYNKDNAIKELISRIGFIKYERKHGESIFTRFFQEYYLPTKYGIDKRISHYSSMIISGQINRDSALTQLQTSLYSDFEIKRDIDYISRKLELTSRELYLLLESPTKSIDEYNNWNVEFNLMKKIQHLMQSVSLNIRKYS